MTFPKLLLSLGIGGSWLALVPPASAHRVDEYLQAARLSIDISRVDLELDLTPGIALASEIFGWIDTNRDGVISDAEGEAYARQVLRSCVVSADGKPIALTLTDDAFPPFRDMRQGVGTIRLKATAAVPAGGAGHHRVSFLNQHRPSSSVYLVNALVPANPLVKLGDAQRDRAQHGLTLDYTVAADAPPTGVFALLAALVIGTRWLLRRRKTTAPPPRLVACERKRNAFTP